MLAYTWYSQFWSVHVYMCSSTSHVGIDVYKIASSAISLIFNMQISWFLDFRVKPLFFEQQHDFLTHESSTQNLFNLIVWSACTTN